MTPKTPATDHARAKKTPSRRQYLPAAERKKQILEAAREVFARSGLKGARTRELAQAAGINQATLFEHFRSKEDLFVAAVVEPLAEWMEGARERAQRYAEADSSENLLELIEVGMQRQLESMVDNYSLLAQALFSDRELGEKLYREHIVPLLQARADTMQGLVKDSMDPQLVQLASFGMFFAVAMDRVMTGKTQDLSEVARQMAGLITFGCTPQRQTD